ncbi:MAG: hypothetical protein IT286_03205 [Proteobacteria bacterium]|nr:hypothetical protein [Pseudomonadota bacterium]
MVVVVIVGILASVGVASYQKYILRSKIAEGYVGLDAMKKQQITHFQNYGHFYDFDGGATHPLPYRGKKEPWFGGVSVNPRDIRLTVTTEDSYFSYTARAGFYDESGNPFTSTYDFYHNPAGELTPKDGSPLNQLEGDMLFKGPGDGRAIGCFNSISDVNPKDVGIQEIPGEHFFASIAGAKFKPEPESVCTILMQFFSSIDGNITSTPIISLNMGK